MQLFDALPAHIEDALRASIERFGVLVPVVHDQHGRIIDGHHRSRIADEIGVTFRTDVVHVANDDEAREIAATLNSDRRQLSEDQRREVVKVLREQGHSIRAIADALKVGKSTVADDISGLSGAGQLATPDRVSRKSGGSYPAARPKAAPAPVPAAPEPVASPEEPEALLTEQESPANIDEAAVRASVADALERHVPDPEAPRRQWQMAFLDALRPTFRLMAQFGVDQVVKQADDECLDELARLADAIVSYRDRVRAARPIPDNVRHLRRVS